MTPNTRPLPPDVMLCRPQKIGSQCNNCKRWSDKPLRVFGSIARVVHATQPKGPDCVFVPVRFNQQKAHQ